MSVQIVQCTIECWTVRSHGKWHRAQSYVKFFARHINIAHLDLLVPLTFDTNLARLIGELRVFSGTYGLSSLVSCSSCVIFSHQAMPGFCNLLRLVLAQLKI